MLYLYCYCGTKRSRNDSTGRLSSRRSHSRDCILLIIVFRDLLAHVVWRAFHFIFGLGFSAKQHTLRVPDLDVMRDIEVLKRLLCDAIEDRCCDVASMMGTDWRIKDYRDRNRWSVNWRETGERGDVLYTIIAMRNWVDLLCCARFAG